MMRSEQARCPYRFGSASLIATQAHFEADDPDRLILNSRERIVIEITLRSEYHGVQDHVDERLPYSDSINLHFLPDRSLARDGETDLVKGDPILDPIPEPLK
jgi:hypothetical protein